LGTLIYEESQSRKSQREFTAKKETGGRGAAQRRAEKTMGRNLAWKPQMDKPRE